MHGFRVGWEGGYPTDHTHPEPKGGTMRILIVALGPALIAAVSAQAQEPDVRLETVETVETKPLATVALDHGGTVEFLELEPGVVIAVEEGVYPAEPTLATLELPENATAADLHRALAPDRPVPEALQVATITAEPADVGDRLDDLEDPGEPAELAVAAKPAKPPIRAVPARPTVQAVPARPAPKAEPAAPSAEPDGPEPGKQEPADPPDPPSGTRATWFQREFCGGGARVSWCWVDRSGTSKKQAWGIGLGATVYSCGGTARFRVQYRRFGKWKSYASRDVLPGHYVSFSRIGVPRTRRSHVQGTCFHHAGGAM